MRELLFTVGVARHCARQASHARQAIIRHAMERLASEVGRGACCAVVGTLDGSQASAGAPASVPAAAASAVAASSAAGSLVANADAPRIEFAPTDGAPPSESGSATGAEGGDRYVQTSGGGGEDDAGVGADGSWRARRQLPLIGLNEQVRGACGRPRLPATRASRAH